MNMKWHSILLTGLILGVVAPCHAVEVGGSCPEIEGSQEIKAAQIKRLAPIFKRSLTLDQMTRVAYGGFETQVWVLGDKVVMAPVIGVDALAFPKYGNTEYVSAGSFPAEEFRIAQKADGSYYLADVKAYQACVTPSVFQKALAESIRSNGEEASKDGLSQFEELANR
jgi:hypothetical protein